MKIALALMISILIFTTEAWAGWGIYTQPEKGGQWKKKWDVETLKQAEQQVKNSCVVQIWGGNYAVKLIGNNAANEELFICDEINKQQRIEADKNAKKYQLKGKEKEKEQKQIKLW